MKADLTRLTFDPAKHYRAVQQQQGRVQLDSDWNEQMDITAHRIETETIDVIGPAGAPLHADGFRLVSSAASLTPEETARAGNQTPPTVVAGDLLITAGRGYVGGVLAQNERICLASAQPDLPSGDEMTAAGIKPLFPLQAPGTYLAYLDVWPRLCTALDDPGIRDVALGGPDTTTRTKNAWQVKLIAAPDGATCATPIPEWTELIERNPGTLAASVKKTPDKTGPCIVDPGSGYRRLENQLYRVEVHTGGDSLGKATFKWSRDNGAIVTRWLDQTALGEITVETTGRDHVLQLAAGHWVELSDDGHEELGLPGVFARIASVNGNTLTLDAPTAAMDRAKFSRNPKVRRWDSAPATPGKWITPDGSAVPLNVSDTFELEDGVVVGFGAGRFRTGDYWLIPARIALPNVDWPTTGPASNPVPVPLPPHGVQHQYGKLAIVEFKSGAFKITDCRNLFPPLTELTNLVYVSGESQAATPNPTLPASTLLPLPLPLKVGVTNGEWPVNGARVRFTVTAGTGAVSAPGGIVVTGPDGIASCNWSLDSGTPHPEVRAELLDAADQRLGVPVIFHARLNVAQAVAYNPAKCAGMSSANPPVVTVQDALDFLCGEKASVDCCVTIGKLGERAGDYATVADALADLLDKRRETSICLTLLPGDHVYERKEPILSKDDKQRLHFKIDGCSQASRLILKVPLVAQRLAAFTLRDIAIVAAEAGIECTSGSTTEISHCHISGRPAKGSALLQFAAAGRLLAHGNQVLALGAGKAISPAATLFKDVTMLANLYAIEDDQEFAAAADKLADGLVELAREDRAKLAERLKGILANAEGNVSGEEREAYAALLAAIGNSRTTAKLIATRLSEVRVVAGAAAGTAPRANGAGAALAFLDFDTAPTLTDNRIVGVVSIGGLPAKRSLNQDEFELINKGLKSGGLALTANGTRLQMRGNELLQWVAGEELLGVLRKGKGKIPTWQTAHVSDNVIAENGNLFLAQHVSLNATRFLAPRANVPVAAAIANTGIYVGNCGSDPKQPLLSLTASGDQAVANHGLTIVSL